MAPTPTLTAAPAILSMPPMTSDTVSKKPVMPPMISEGSEREATISLVTGSFSNPSNPGKVLPLLGLAVPPSSGVGVRNGDDDDDVVDGVAVVVDGVASVIDGTTSVVDGTTSVVFGVTCGVVVGITGVVDWVTCVVDGVAFVVDGVTCVVVVGVVVVGVVVAIVVVLVGGDVVD